MEDKVLKDLQSYLEYIRYNTIDFGLRLIKPFKVCRYSVKDSKYRAIFDEHDVNDSYWVEQSELNKFLSGGLANQIVLRTSRPFDEEGRSGFYMLLSENKLELDLDNIELLFGLRFKLNDIFFKIEDISYQKLKMLDGEELIDDNVKIYVVKDFFAEDFLEVNKFIDTAKSVTKGMGYSMEIQDEGTRDYVALSDAKIALKIARQDSYNALEKKLDKLFPIKNKLSICIREMLKEELIR